MADPMTIFGGLMSLMGSMGGGKEDRDPAPAPVAQEREKAPKVEAKPLTGADKQREAIQSNRNKQAASGSTSTTRGGVSFMGE